MRGRFNETDVLIVGAGPTGLMAALDLASRNVSLRIIDKAPARSDKSRALVVQARSLEMLQKRGLADGLIEAGQKAARARFIVGGSRTYELELGDIRVEDSPYPFTLFVSQAETERVIEGALEELDHHVQRSVELVACLDAGDRIVATLRHANGREEKVRTRYLLGCDGAHSTVRRAAGIGFEGAPYHQDFILADMDVCWKDELSHDALEVVLASGGLLAVFPFKEHPRCLTRFRLHHRVAEHYRRDRIFLAGDAAHIHGPAGGQGMNIGLQDATNLGWKLALVLRGRAPDRLLDSYELERRPVGQKLLRHSDRFFSLASSCSPVICGVRNLLMSILLPRLAANPAGRARLFRFVSQLGIRYAESPIVAEDLSAASAEFRRGPGKGARAPDGPLCLPQQGATTLFARLTGQRHHLLVFAGPTSSTLPARESLEKGLGSAHGDLLRTHVILGRNPVDVEPQGVDVCVDAFGLLHGRYGVVQSGLYLVRPDGYIAYRAASVNAGGLAEYLDDIFGAMVAPAPALSVHRAP